MRGNGKKDMSFLFHNELALFAVLLVSLFFAVVFFSCSHSSEDHSFLTTLDSIDSSISTGQADDALAQLKKIEKKAYSSYARLGIYRRYMTLGETVRAEKVLVRGLKQIPENRELSAVYGQFLLRQNRLEEAKKVSACLAGSPYGSIYSEAVLALARQNAKNTGSNGYYLNEEFRSVYYDAYTGTRDNRWLRDVALLLLKKGDYESAANLQNSMQTAGRIPDARDSLFWAIVQFDGGNYAQCLSDLDEVSGMEFEPDGSVIAESEALRADCYKMLGDSDAAESYRAALFARAASDSSISVPPSLFVNSAKWAEQHNQTNYQYSMLSSVCEKYPEYMPGLIAYSSFAYESSKPVPMTALERDVRKSKLRTLAMEQYDELPRVPVSDALYRLQTVLDEQKKQSGAMNPLLLCAYKNLLYKTTPHLTQAARIADVWKTLESNQTGTNLYPPLLVDFAVHELLAAGRTEDARDLFESYLDAKYLLNGESDEGKKSSDSSAEEKKSETDIFGGEKKNAAITPPEVVRAAFGDRAASGINEMESWECEDAAYFAVLDNNIAAAKRLYEYVLFETGNVHSRMQNGSAISEVSQLASPSSIANLAMIYSSTEEKEKALSLYGAAAGRSNDPIFKAQMLCRTACIQRDENDSKNAVLSLEYALSLNPAYADARLLLRQLTSQ